MNNISSLVPPPPNYFAPQSNAISPETSSQQPQQNIQQIPQEISLYLQGYDNYIHNFHNHVIPRIEEYEKNQKEILIALGRERLLEKSTQRLISINFYFCIIIPFVLVSIFILFCFYYAPDEVKLFFKEYKILFSCFSISYIIAMIKPVLDIRSYNKWLDAIEKKLRLNGND